VPVCRSSAWSRSASLGRSRACAGAGSRHALPGQRSQARARAPREATPRPGTVTRGFPASAPRRPHQGWHSIGLGRMHTEGRDRNTDAGRKAPVLLVRRRRGRPAPDSTIAAPTGAQGLRRSGVWRATPPKRPASRATALPGSPLLDHPPSPVPRSRHSVSASPALLPRKRRSSVSRNRTRPRPRRHDRLQRKRQRRDAGVGLWAAA
jgi:hypothetical protein